MAQIGTIEGVLKLRDELTSKLQRAASNVEKAGKRMQRVGGQISSVGSGINRNISLPLAAAGAAAFKFSSDFSTSLTKIETLVGVNRGTVQGWRDDILKLSGETARAPRELADAMFFVTSAGLRGEVALETLTASARAAALGLGETTSIADAATSAMNAYGPATLSASNATNILALAVRAGKLEAAELAPVMGRLLPTASSLGIAFEDVAGVMAVMSRTGLNAAEASTSLNSIMNLLAKGGTKQAKKILREVGLSMGDLRDMAAKPGGLIEAMRLLDERTSNLSEEALAQVIPNIRAFRGVMNVLAQDSQIVDDVMGQVASGVDVLGTGMRRVAEEPGFRFQQMLQKGKIRLIELGDQLAPTFLKLIDLGTKFLDLVGRWIEAFSRLSPASQKMILALGGIAIAAGPVLIVTGKLITAWGILTAAAPGVVAAVASVSGAFLPAAAAIGLLLVLDSRITAWADSLVDDMNRIAERTNNAGRAWNQLRLEITQGLGLVSEATFQAAKAEAEALRQSIQDSEAELQKLKETGEDVVETGHVGLETESKRAKQLKQQIQIDKDRLAVAEKQLDAAKDGLDRAEALRKKSAEIAKQVAKADADRERSLKRQETVTEKMLEARLRAVQVELSLTHEAGVNQLLLAASAEEAELIRLALEKGLDPLTEMTATNRRLLLLLKNQEELLENHLELANDIVQAMENAMSLRRGIEFDPLLITPVTSDEFLAAAGLDPEEISKRAQEIVDSLTTIVMEGGAADLQSHLDESWNEWLKSLETASMDKTFQNLAEGLHQAFSDTFKRIFDEGLKGFEGLIDAVKGLVTNVLSESLASELSSIIAEQITILRKRLQQAMQGGGGFGEALNSVLGGTGGIWATVGIVAANIIASDNRTAAAAATAVGAAIGAAIGTFVFPAVGTAVGAQLGAIFGSILGSFIKSGTPEFFAAVRSEAGKVTFGESAMGAGFQRVGHTIGAEISDTVDAVLGQLGASLVGISDEITLKLKNGLSVFLGSQEFDFGDAMAEGLEFAIVEIIKRSDLGNIEPEVERALQFSSANTVQELLSDLQFVREQIRANLDQIAQQFLRFVDEAKAAASRLESLGLDPGIAFEKLGSQLIGLRDQILGVQEDPAARIRRQAAAFNARVRILEAEQQAKEAQLQFERETLAAEVAMLKAELGIAEQSMTIKREMLRADQQITQAEQGLLRTKLQQLAAVDAALAAAESILANLPALISDEEINRAIGRLGRGGGGARRAFEDRIQEITNSLLPQFAQGLLELSLKYEELLEQARRFRRSEEEIMALRRQEAQAIGQQIRDRISEFLTPAQGGTFGLSGPQRQAQEIRQRFEEIREQTAALLEQEGELALTREEILEAERRAMEQLGESVIDGLGLPLEETRDRIGSFRDSLGFLWQQTLAGEMAFERFAEIIAQAGDQAFLSLGDSILGFVDRYGVEIENMEAFRLKLERVRFELERANLVLQFELLREIGILTEEMIEFIGGALGEIMALDFPDIQIPDAPSRGRDRGRRPDVTPDQSPVVDAINQQEQQLERILEGWRASAERSASDQLQILRDQRQQAMELARELGKDIDRVLEEFQGALERFTDQLLEGVRGVREEIATGAAGGAARLAPTARLARAEEQLRQQVASVLGGDLDAVDRVDDLARQALNALGDVFLGGGRAFDVRAGEIDRLLELVEQQVQQQVQAQGNSDAAMAPANQQTQADILAALGATNTLLREIRDDSESGDDELFALLSRLATSQESLVEQLGRMT